jgi:hypothetical protein
MIRAIVELLTFAVVLSFVLLGVDRVLGWVEARIVPAVERWLRWRRIRKDMAATAKRIGKRRC